jgi:hypothetical protein
MATSYKPIYEFRMKYLFHVSVYTSDFVVFRYWENGLGYV